MADQILKSTSDKIWVNSAGKVMKAKKFNESVLQVGLSFWGAADPNYLTLVDGLVSEAYDIRGTGEKMIQNTVINRPAFTSNMIGDGASASKYLNMSGQNIRSMFIVMIPTNFFCGLGTSYSVPYIGRGITKLGLLTSSISTYNSYVNNIKYTDGYTFSNNSIKYIISSLDSVNYSIITLGDLAGGKGCKVLEWGWYNRVLSELEVIYNINALNTKYSIF